MSSVKLSQVTKATCVFASLLLFPILIFNQTKPESSRTGSAMDWIKVPKI